MERVLYYFRYRYWRGRSIHSPFVYGLVRAVFMPRSSTTIAPHEPLLQELMAQGLSRRFALRAAQYFSYMHYGSYRLDPERYAGEELVIFTGTPDPVQVERLLSQAEEQVEQGARRSVTLLLCNPYAERSLRQWWCLCPRLKIDLYRMGFLVLDTNLHPQWYKLKIR